MLDIHFELTPEFSIKENDLEAWIDACLQRYDCHKGDLCIVFCSDDYLLDLNKEHLNHDYYTDIITFDYSVGNVVSGDLFISVDRVKENAVESDVSWTTEMSRVVIHGCLHLCGLKDKTDVERNEMRDAENVCLAALNVECFT